jgi:hypothetical protein
MGLLEEVRAAAASTSAVARFVHIESDAIAAYAAWLPVEQARSAELDPATHYLRHGQGTLAYVLALDAINFGSGYFPHLRKRPGMSGYFTVASSLKDAFEADGPMSSQQLARLSAGDCARIFGQSTDAPGGEARADTDTAPRGEARADTDPVSASEAHAAANPVSASEAHAATDTAAGGWVSADGDTAPGSGVRADSDTAPGSGVRAETDLVSPSGAHAPTDPGGEASSAAVAELMALFARALNDLGTFVTDRFGGSFEALVDAANGSAERLVGILQQMPFYQDVGFYKRAQLTAADLALAGVAHFDDLDQLTIFADNLVPHVLRVDRILSYTPELLVRIEHGELIPSGSREEIEIRACALHAVELIRRCLSNITSMQLDYVLWNRGQTPAYKALPRHRTRTVFY